MHGRCGPRPPVAGWRRRNLQGVQLRWCVHSINETGDRREKLPEDQKHPSRSGGERTTRASQALTTHSVTPADRAGDASQNGLLRIRSLGRELPRDRLAKSRQNSRPRNPYLECSRKADQSGASGTDGRSIRCVHPLTAGLRHLSPAGINEGYTPVAWRPRSRLRRATPATPSLASRADRVNGFPAKLFTLLTSVSTDFAMLVPTGMLTALLPAEATRLGAHIEHRLQDRLITPCASRGKCPCCNTDIATIQIQSDALR